VAKGSSIGMWTLAKRTKAMQEVLSPLERRAVMRVRIQHNDVIYATSQTHVGTAWYSFILKATGRRSLLQYQIYLSGTRPICSCCSATAPH